jgi:hypothetical protein
MPAGCVVNLDDITTLPKLLIKQRITALSTEKIQQVDQARSDLLCTWTDPCDFVFQSELRPFHFGHSGSPVGPG